MERAGAQQKAMGEALFEESLLSSAIRGSGDPLIEPLISFAVDLHLFDGVAALTGSGFVSPRNTRSSKNRSTVEERDRFPRDRRHSRARYENSNQIQGIGSRECNVLMTGLNPPCRPHRFHCHWQCKLLSQKTIDKAAAANLATILQPPESREQFTPWRQIRFARQQVANHDAPAPQQHPAR